MADRITEARRAVAEAAEAVDDRTVREQLQSIDEGLGDVGEEPDDAEKGDRLESVEAKLAGLGDETDGEVADHVGRARDLIDAYRRDRAQDWPSEGGVSAADEGRPVVDEAGQQVGVVAAVDAETVAVDPDPDLGDDVRTTLGWGESQPAVQRVPREALRRTDVRSDEDGTVLEIDLDATNRSG